MPTAAAGDAEALDILPWRPGNRLRQLEEALKHIDDLMSEEQLERLVMADDNICAVCHLLMD